MCEAEFQVPSEVLSHAHLKGHRLDHAAEGSLGSPGVRWSLLWTPEAAQPHQPWCSAVSHEPVHRAGPSLAEP